MKNEPRMRLSNKLLLVQLGSLCLALAIFFTGMMVGSRVLDLFYLSPEAEAQRLDGYVRELTDYVRDNDLRSTDREALESWTREQKYVYLAVYRGETPIFQTDGYTTADLRTSQEEELIPDADGYYRMAFADGVFRVAVLEVAETPYYDLVVILSLALACLAMILVNLGYNRNITRDIVRLSKEVGWVEQGILKAPIQSRRGDEIGDLARSVEEMRRAIIQRMQSEQDAWAANSGLITAISHDVRTPLTALMGYLDLLEGGQYQNPQQMERYLRASRDKARQLKELTDELFRYFLVFATPEMQLNMEEYDARILTEQLLGERMIGLEEHGFAVQSTTLLQDCRIRVDVQYLQRVLDNLFNNIEKHACRQERVHLLVRREGEQLVIDLANGVPERPRAAESTRIGLQTCRKIIREMGGVFETRLEEGKFLAEIALPVVKTQQFGEEGGL